MNPPRNQLWVDEHKGDISIDNFQGMARFRSSVKNKINLGDVGSAAVIVDAPESHVQFNLKSLHSSSYIRCASAEITFEEEFD